MKWLKSISNKFNSKEKEEPVTEFTLIPEVDDTPRPIGTIVEARAHVLALGPKAFEFTPASDTSIPESLPDTVKEFFREYSSVWSPIAEINLSLEDIMFSEGYQLWSIEANGTWEYGMYCFPTPNSKIYQSAYGRPVHQCQDVFDSVWHYLWYFHNFFSNE